MMEQLRNALKHVVLLSFYLSHHRNKECYHTGADGGGGGKVESDVFKRYQQKRVRRFKNDVDLAANTVSELRSSRPEPKRPGHTSFLLFIKTQITNITLFPLLILLEPAQIYSSWMLLPTTDWDSSVKDQHFINFACVWAMYGSGRE